MFAQTVRHQRGQMTDPDTAMRMIRKVQRELVAAREVVKQERQQFSIEAVRIATLKMQLSALLG